MSISCNYDNKSKLINSDNVRKIEVFAKEFGNNKITLNKKYAKINQSKNVDYIKLESISEALFGNVDQLICVKDFFIIVDRRNAKGVFIFNTDGKFLLKIQNHGKGPGEFTKITDVSFNKFSNQIEIYDSTKQSIIVYDLNGKFISELKNPINCQRFIPITKNERFYYSKFIPNKHELQANESYRLVKANDKGSVIEYYFPFKNENLFETHIINAFNNFLPVENSNKVLFIETYDNNIYELEEGSVSIKYVIDFLNHNVPEDLLKSNIKNKLEYVNEKNFAYINRMLFEDEEELIFNYTHDNSYKEFGYNKISGDSYQSLFNYIEHDNIYCSNSISVTKNFSYSIIEPIQLLQLETQDNLSPRVQKIIRDIKDTDNPIIVKIKR